MIAMFLFGASLSAEFQPTGKWELNYQPNLCRLARQYGDKVVGMEWQPIASGYTIFEFDPSIRKAPRRQGQVDTMIDPGGPTKGFLSQYDAGERGRLTTVAVQGDPAAMLEKVSTIRLTDRPDASTYRITDGVQVAKALRGCRDDWLRQIGQSVEEYAKVVTSAQPIGPADWLSFGDYPESAIRAGQQGDSVVMWRVRIDGRVEDCRTISSAGAKVLDDAACKAITAHGRYVPAKDADGRPISSIESRQVRWRLPR